MTFLVKQDIFIKTDEKIGTKKFKIYFNYGLFIMLKNYIDFKAVGIYTISLTVGSAIGMVGNVFSRSVPPKISKCLEIDDNIKLEKIYKENTKQQIYIGLFLLIYLIVFSKEVLALMGKEYIDGYIVLILIGIGQMINIGTGMCGNIIGSSKHYKYEAYFNIFLLVVTVGTNMLFIPLYGIVGAAFATALTLILINIMKVIFVYRKFNMHPYRLENLKFIVAGIIITIILYTIKKFVTLNIVEIGIILIIMFGIYDGVLYLLKDEDILSIKLIKKIR